MTATPDELLTARQVADLLGVNHKYVYDLISRGHLATDGEVPVLIRRRDADEYRRRRNRRKEPNPDMVVEVRGIVADIATARRRLRDLIAERNLRAAWWADEGGEPVENIADAAGGVHRPNASEWIADGREQRRKNT
jgi:hypothetical protein